ncbi:MAG TPA: ATP-binding protein [Candidatus Limnocylindria bacterium]|nr:ATP-binding protein [Candidatus Limnocylindria bacterium]
MVVQVTRHERAAVERGARDTARALSLAVDRDLLRSMTTLEALATSRELDAGEPGDFVRKAQRVLPTQDGWLDIMLYDRAGRELLTASAAGAPAAGAAAEVVLRVAETGRPSVSDLQAVAPPHDHVVTVSVPVVRDGRIRYVLAARLAPELMAGMLRQQRLPETWTGAIVDRRKVFIARTRDGQRLTGAPASTLLAQHASAASEGSFDGVTVDDIPVYSSFSRSPLTGWTVAIGIPRDEVQPSLARSFTGVVGAGALLGLLAIGLALLLGRRIATAIGSLKTTAAALGVNEPAVAMPSAVAEINEVGRAIEEASALLRRRSAERDAVEVALHEREERLRLALTAGRMATWDWDVRADTVRWSNDHEALWREHCDTFEGTATAALRYVHAGDRDVLCDTLDRVLKHGGACETEFRVRWPSGADTWIALRGQAMRDGDERVVRLLGVATDITERKAAEAKSRELAALVESSEDAIIGKTLEGVIVSWNRGAQRIYGYTEEEARGRPLAFLLPPDRAAEMAAILESVRRGEAVESLDAVCVRGDGGFVEVSLTVSPVRDAAGRIVGAASIARDMTAKRRVDKQLAGLQTLTDVALAHLSLNDLLRELLGRLCGVLACDVSSILLLSDDGTHLVVRASHGIEGDRGTVVELGRGVVGGVAATKRAVIIDDLTAVEVDNPHLRAGGLRSLLGVPLLVDGRVIGVVHIATRLTRHFSDDETRLLTLAADRMALAIDHARLYEAERAARREAERANRSKDQFIATLSHELRTPLQAMLGWLRMLRSGRLDPRQAARALETVERNTEAQSQLINDLLDVSRIVSGKLSTNMREVDAGGVVGAALEAVRPTAEAAGIRLGVTLPETTVTVSADADRLQQIIWNLLSNAIKFTPAGGAVDLSLETSETEAIIRVRDTGRGIAPAVLPEIFERFRQADGTTTREHGGLGLGLAIVRHLVDLHHGRVEAESAGTDQGATFTVRLPLSAPAAGGPAPRVLRAGAPGAPETFPELGGIRVLVVDDERDARELVHAVLVRCGAEVTTAGSAAEALASLQRAPHDVLLSDIAMPGEDGYQLIRRVRALHDAPRAGIPAAALTAYARLEDRDAALAAGYQMHVAKPVEPAVLARVVQTLSGRLAS